MNVLGIECIEVTAAPFWIAFLSGAVATLLLIIVIVSALALGLYIHPKELDDVPRR